MAATWIQGVLATLLMGACVSGPSGELVAARATYARAATSPTATYAPEQLLYARGALDQAERAHDLAPGSYEERHLAYLAQRRAEIAIVSGDLRATEVAAADRAARAAAQRDAARTELARTERKLDATRSELAEQRGQLDARTAELEQHEAELVARSAQLRAEQEALAQAQRERDAALKAIEKFAKIEQQLRGLVITLSGSVLFGFNESTLLPNARERLDQVATALQLDDTQTIVIEGHTDALGTKEANRTLAQERAATVRAYLVSRGVAPDRIVAIGKGEDEPVASNDSPEGRANNRRVEIVISPPRSASAP